MRYSVLLLVIALAIAVAQAQSPPFPCTYVDGSGLRYDLSRLWRAPGVADFAYADPSGSFDYAINVCGQTNTQCYPDAGVCQSTNVGPLGAGSAAQAVWGAFSNGTGISIQLSVGGNTTLCPVGLGRSSLLEIACDMSVTSDAVVDSVSEPVPCAYTIKMRSRYACPITAPTSGSSTNTFYLSGGLPFCTQCGAQGQYACSSGGVGTWQSSFVYRDPVPSGAILSRLDISLIGSYACASTPSVMSVTINGVPVNILQSAGSNACQCNSCDGAITYTAIFAPFNVPYYSYGGNNTVYLTILSGSTCLNAVNVTSSWDPPTYPGTQAALVRTDISRYNDYKVCNTVGYDSSSTISVTFDDPLPGGSILLMVNTQIFGSFWCYSTSSVAPVITTSLGGTQIGRVTLGSRGRSGSCSWGVQCDGAVWTPSSSLYQNGWPSYAYGGRNTLTITTTYYPRIGGVAVYLTYYQAGQVNTISIIPDDE